MADTTSRVPRIRRLRITRTGLVLRIRMRPGQDAFSYGSASGRLRHIFGMWQVTAREVRSGTVELAMGTSVGPCFRGGRPSSR